MILDPDTISYRLKNAQLNPEVIEEIRQAIIQKNELDQYKNDLRSQGKYP